ncbi:uncharacterized, partial [Tachysurus ichikawai]
KTRSGSSPDEEESEALMSTAPILMYMLYNISFLSPVLQSMNLSLQIHNKNISSPAGLVSSRLILELF